MFSDEFGVDSVFSERVDVDSECSLAGSMGTVSVLKSGQCISECSLTGSMGLMSFFLTWSMWIVSVLLRGRSM